MVRKVTGYAVGTHLLLVLLELGLAKRVLRLHAVELLHLFGDAIDDIVVHILQIDEDSIIVLCEIYIGISEQSKDVPVLLPAEALRLPYQVVSALHTLQFDCLKTRIHCFMRLCCYEPLRSHGLM